MEKAEKFIFEELLQKVINPYLRITLLMVIIFFTDFLNQPAAIQILEIISYRLVVNKINCIINSKSI